MDEEGRGEELEVSDGGGLSVPLGGGHGGESGSSTGGRECFLPCLCVHSLGGGGGLNVSLGGKSEGDGSDDEDIEGVTSGSLSSTCRNRQRC